MEKQKINENFEELKKQKLYSRPQTLNDLKEHPNIEGHNFEKKFNFDEFLNSYITTGFQGSNFGQAIQIVKAMRRDNAKIYLSFTSNMISSGLRDIITFLVKNKFVDIIVTSGGGVEEDIIKINGSFKLGSFEASSKMLYDNSIFRTGNLFIPNNRYANLELLMDPLFKKLYLEGKKTLATNELIYEIGKELEFQNLENKESSYIYWAYKNNIPIFCPGLVDGAIGDMLGFFKYNHKDFYLDTIGDTKKINDLTLQFDKTGFICLGAGLPKHFAMNANILREGFEYVVLINTAQEYDGCDSGARIDEAKTWCKVKLDAFAVKVHSDATIAFPLLVAGTFKKEYDEKNKLKK